MGIIRMVGTTAVTLGIIGAGLQLTGAYNVKDNVVAPVVETVQSENYEALKEMKMIRLSDTDYLWGNISKGQKTEFMRRGIAGMTLEERAELIKREWQKVPQSAKYQIVKTELEAMLEQFYK